MKGNMHAASNEKHEINSAYIYQRVLVYKDGKWETLLMTDSDLERIRKRSSKNEDMALQPSWLDKVLVWLGF